MSETLISEHGLSLWERTRLFPRHFNRAASATPSETLPEVRPGQLWYVELPSTEPAVSPLEYRALTTANVVVYDRALEPAVASSLPLGAYAEPAPPRDGAIERCLSFARDGWSVARLVDPGGQRLGIIRQLSERLLKFEASAALAVSVFANTDGSYEKIAAELGELREVMDAHSFGPAVTLTIVFAGIGAGTAPRFVVASANGLAG
jgi:hypothetical protein